MQQTVFLLNTMLLIAALIVFELVYGDTPKQDRAHLRFFYPLLFALGGVLLFAVYKQVKVA